MPIFVANNFQVISDCVRISMIRMVVILHLLSIQFYYFVIKIIEIVCRLFVALTGIQYAGGHLRELQKAVKVFNDYIVPQLLYI